MGLVAVVVAVLGGCSSSRMSGPAMMGGNSNGAHLSGSAMMGGPAGYHYSTLRCSAPKSLPGRTVTVTLADMGMTTMMSGTAPMGARMLLRASATTEPAGRITLVASNVGWRTHELVILPLTAGAGPGVRAPGSDGKVSEVGSVGEASARCAAGAGKGIAAGTVSWVTVTLKPGRYELVCNLPNHYADGMHATLIIT